ncbi:coiled-coil domain-containing protein 25, partial [Empidonax traillii]|uniref:coiled-coil domain-containing protein 25 n=1 Tax=Empidonax traillii TaxID=164674 RepID=UPI000FFD8B45
MTESPPRHLRAASAIAALPPSTRALLPPSPPSPLPLAEGHVNHSNSVAHWFHVDKLSSAHVYLRLHKGQTVDDIPKEVLIDCAHLVKANSIQGCKMNNVTVVYTPWTNLKKTADMDVGQIGFHRQKDVSVGALEHWDNGGMCPYPALG